MITGKLARQRSGAKGALRRKLAPMIEVFESRQLLDAGIGTIAGTVYLDANKSGAIDAADTYLSGVTVQLFRAGTATPLATVVTDSRGGYAFRGLAAGNYRVVEVPPTDQKVVANRVLSDIYSAAPNADRSISVTIPDSDRVFANYTGVMPGKFLVVSSNINGKASVDSAGQLGASIGSAPGRTDIDASLLTFCLDDLHRLPFSGGVSFQVRPRSITELTNGVSTTPISADHAGRIAYLYNHFGNSSLTNIQGAGLQLAIWELIYDSGATPDLSSGNFKVTGAVDPSTPAEVAQGIAQANAYLAASQGKSEAALYLQATSAIGTPAPDTDGFQSLIAHGTFDFANDRNPPPPTERARISGYTYCDANDNGVKETTEFAIPGVLITLTGKDNAGQPVTRTTRTDATGFYQFTDLVPGTYSIVETQPTGYLDGKDTQGTPGTGATLNDSFKDIRLAAGVDGKNNNFGEHLPAPTVSKLQLLGIHRNPTSIVLAFKGALDPSQASNTANYTLLGLGHDERLGTRDDTRIALKSATYDPVGNTVTLRPDRHLNIHYHYALSLKVPAASPCAPPAQYVTVFGRSAVPYFTRHNGAKYPAPAMSAHAIRHDAAVVRHAEGVIARNGGLPTARTPVNPGSMAGMTREAVWTFQTGRRPVCPK